ncbi:MAG: acetyl-CoA carboxylase carboxyltransferase subunit alpha [Endomicrobiia bacterium]
MCAEYFLEFEKPIEELTKKINELQQSSHPDMVVKAQIVELQKQCENLKKEIYTKLTPSQKVLIARHPQRPYTLDYISAIFKDFIEFHGDRNFRDDKSVICGFASLELSNTKTISVAIVGQQKGRSLEENVLRNFGMMHPEGYRKALRIMKLAEKFFMPVITFIDTPGAYPGIGAEERGQAEAIAKNLFEMSKLNVPIISIVISEGGSGGALGIGVADILLMLENAYYSVISPEGCASILFRDSTKWQQAAEVLKITAKDLYEMKIVDKIIPEPLGGAHKNFPMVASTLKKEMSDYIMSLLEEPINKLVEKRYKKYRSFGQYKIVKKKK